MPNVNYAADPRRRRQGEKRRRVSRRKNSPREFTGRAKTYIYIVYLYSLLTRARADAD